MYTAAEVDGFIEEWKKASISKAQLVWYTAEACLGWPYVFGAAGELCNISTRKKYYNNYASRKPAEAEQIKKRCRVLSGSASSCSGCTYYPGGNTRCYDCRGFTRWCLAQVGITLRGAGATSQWNDNSNWLEKGKIEDLPNGVLACFFHQNGTTMEHTGFALNGQTIHCSGTVKRGTTKDRGVTHYAIPKGLDDQVPDWKPTLRKGDRGEYVTLAQTDLVKLGFGVGSKGCDGIFGKDTEAAVKSCQAAFGLTVDGIVGQNTWAVLEGEQPVTYYTVTVPHLTLPQANELISKYPGSEKKQEGGV